MKKWVQLTLMVLLAASYTPAMAAHETDPVRTVLTSEEEAAKANRLLSRLEQIRTMDKSGLTREQRKDLRKEVKDIKTQLRTTGNGIYLSIGAIIIIILLLILLL